MVSETDIANLALGRIKQGVIASLDDDDACAAAAKRLYPMCRDKVLADFPWRVARRVRALAPLVNDRPDDWAYRYQRPTCLTIWRVLRESGPAHPQRNIPYEADHNGLYSNAEGLRAVVIESITDTTLYTPKLVSCIAWDLARELVMPLEADLNLQIYCERKYAAEKDDAWATDAAEDLLVDDGTMPVPTLSQARL